MKIEKKWIVLIVSDDVEILFSGSKVDFQHYKCLHFLMENTYKI